ncbi:uncharacterized protein SAMN02745164_02263 [Marinitoga hydrogenitolerans DSM 16785]|uniref:Radical SAM core domain-containing protein n=1 Tax=Marinitoga hydrogenitolerans (strain DSM 16785 / JCM 12826 / AT1271) TaxID=1122195 RepID=A0A1M5ATD8_MARH1|nr:radical SAM protein [Marinitoga hydrogenitolerans]SHF33464.1 uncharacterized protein SAMN02745164_02263 [Marinitoga hydrogenitolerans DSM 16785]
MDKIRNKSQKYKHSKFNVEIKKDDTWIIFNTYTHGMLELNEEYYKNYKNFYIENPKIEEKFIEYGMWIDKELDEIDRLRYIHNKNKFDNKIFSLTIKTTNNCNFLCSYCYQSHNKKMMENNTINSIKKWIDKTILENQIEILNIHWFGGEPLLNLNVIIEIENYIQDNYKDVNFFSNLTTNGFLLTKDNILKLKNTKIKTIQITLDGDKEQHNKSRILRNRKGTYDQIIKNILLLLDIWPEVDIILRLNINKNNENIENYLYELKNYKILSKENVMLHFNEAKKFDINYTNEDIFYNDIKEYSKVLLKIYITLLRYGKKIPFYDIKGYNCGFDRINTFLVETDGTLYHCTSSEKEKVFEMGYIDNNGDLNLNEKNYYKKILRNPFSGECLNCKVLPWCMGGCFLLETKKLKKCIPEKYILNDLIELYYEEAINNEKNSRF